MKKTSLYILLIYVLLAGCKSSISEQLVKAVDANCQKSNCVIVLKDITKFDWDKMYMFGDWTAADSISKVIGFNYYGKDVPDDYSRILFTYKNEVVYEDDFKAMLYKDTRLEFAGATPDSLTKRCALSSKCFPGYI